MKITNNSGVDITGFIFEGREVNLENGKTIELKEEIGTKLLKTFAFLTLDQGKSDSKSAETEEAEEKLGEVLGDLKDKPKKKAKRTIKNIFKK